jgi:hypothetical protein
MTWLTAAGTVVLARPHSPAACPPAVRHLPLAVPRSRGSGRQPAGLLKIQGPAQRAGKGSTNPGRDALCHLILLSRLLRSRSARRT